MLAPFEPLLSQRWAIDLSGLRTINCWATVDGAHVRTYTDHLADIKPAVLPQSGGLVSGSHDSHPYWHQDNAECRLVIH